jgi:TFIIF-interacting CTD phosphatase-like protein
MDGYYIVFERPGLQRFLDWLFREYRVSVWTAASKDYALFVVDKIILKNTPDRKLDFIFFSYHCDISNAKKAGTKDLTTLGDIFKLPGYTLKNTVILDDYDEVHNTQPGNCIVALPFEYTSDDSHQDGFLNALQPHLASLQQIISQGGSLQDGTKDVNKKMLEWKKNK